jgi:hypothetical protein
METGTSTVTFTPTVTSTMTLQPVIEVMGSCVTFTLDGKQNCDDFGTLESVVASSARLHIQTGLDYRVCVFDGCIFVGGGTDGYGNEFDNYFTSIYAETFTDALGGGRVPLSVVGNDLVGAIPIGQFPSDCASAGQTFLAPGNNPYAFTAPADYLFLRIGDGPGYCGDNRGSLTVEVCPLPTPTP